MSKSKHTPGPWEFEKVHSTFMIWRKESDNLIVRDIKGLANARLIAAAPELLEALERIAQYIEPTAADAAAMQAIARAAIAKATAT